jgi:predicted ATPase
MADEIRGRDRELAELADFAGAVAAGESRFALISGLPGTGRSRLLDAAGRHARDQGFTVLHGRATPVTLRQPRSIFCSLRPQLRSVVDHENALCWHTVADRLSELLADGRMRKPILFCLDDVHWADPESMFVVRHLLTELSGAPIGWLATARTNAWTAELDSLLGPDAVALELKPLPEGVVGQMVADILGATPEPDLLAFVARTGGIRC